MNGNNMKTKFDNENTVFSKTREYMKKNLAQILVLASTFAVLAVISFFDVSVRDTVASYSLSEYQVGQIADRTIVAIKSIPSSGENVPEIAEKEKIIRKGFPITEDDYRKLRILSETPDYIDYRAFAGMMVFVLALFPVAVFLLSEKMIRRRLALKEIIFLCVSIVLVILTAAILSKIPVFASPFILSTVIPAALAVILTAVLVGDKAAAVFSIIVSLGVLCADEFSLVPFLFVLFSCLAACRIVRKPEKRIELIFASLIFALANMLIMFVLWLVFPQSFGSPVVVFTGTAVNGFLTGILALGLLTPLESLMNTASIFRLMDLSDLNSPVMKKLLLSAPGTYNHSMMVATLAEDACREIGANPLLARVGAYYHDLGKMEQPEYFVENQREGNKHDELNPRLSVAVIRRHVKNGLEKARQLHLPDEVVNIIGEHHGNSVISYFYNEAKKLDDQVSPEEYSYPGTPPSSRESAVVMLADTVEAACRTLEKPSVPRLEKFIHELIMKKFESGQLDNSDLTFKDLEMIKNSFVNILAGYYHSRIEYPNQKDPDQDDTPKKPAAENAKPSAVPAAAEQPPAGDKNPGGPEDGDKPKRRRK